MSTPDLGLMERQPDPPWKPLPRWRQSLPSGDISLPCSPRNRRTFRCTPASSTNFSAPLKVSGRCPKTWQKRSAPLRPLSNLQETACPPRPSHPPVRPMGRQGSEEMSLWVACISREGVSLATDSAQGLNFDGESRAELGQKVWPLGSGVWIAAAGAFRLWPPPASWPDPTPDGDMPPRNFDQLLRALGDQLDGDALTSSSYQVAVVSVSDGFPKLGKLTSRRIEIARPGTIFTGSYANGVRLSAPALAPTSLTKCRDLVIALASRALRTYRDAKNSEAGPCLLYTSPS